MPVEWTDDPTAFRTKDWTSLVESDPGGTYFHTPRYLKLYWEEFCPSGLQLAFVQDGNETIAATAFDITEGVVTFLGGFEVTDYMGPVGLPTARERAAKELMAALAAREDWRTADLRGLPEDGGWWGALLEGGRDAGLEVETGDDGIAPVLPLASSFDSYLSGLRGRLRHEIRRKFRRLHEALPSAGLVETTTETLAPDISAFLDLHRSSTGPKGKFMHPGMELFFRRLGHALLPNRTFRLVFLEAEGEKFAGAVGFRDRRRFLLYNSAYDHSRSGLSPGIVLVAKLIERLIQEGCEALDLLKGDEEYKHRLGARPRRIGRLFLRRR
jgi:CelD/BcsL family acetyltransferase involved in cellulose biosynthesis